MVPLRIFLLTHSLDKSIAYTLLDHNNQAVVLVRNDTVKDLGVWFDEKLSVREHILVIKHI